MEKIVKLAEELGQTIADSPQAQNMIAARQALDADTQATKALEEFQKHSQKMQEMEARQQPIEVEDKQKLQALHAQLMASSAFKAINAAQMEYADLMRKVSDAIHRTLDEKLA